VDLALPQIADAAFAEYRTDPGMIADMRIVTPVAA
jgi:hypothetical protein